MSSSPTIVLRSKPSIVPIIIVWPVTGVVFACILLGFASTLGQNVPMLGVIFAAFAFLILALAVLRLTLELVKREFTTYTLTDTHITKEFGILTHRTSSMPVDRSRVDIVTPLAGRLFGYGSLRVECTGLAPMILYYVPNPHRWEEEIGKRCGLRAAPVPPGTVGQVPGQPMGQG
ncbi:MAG: PH domain-containing protein [Chloroflexi bacterium]|nr:PH domain-containing protein [Chloroflexota bacterium]